MVGVELGMTHELGASGSFLFSNFGSGCVQEVRFSG